jgi:hypothetical protein
MKTASKGSPLEEARSLCEASEWDSCFGACEAAIRSLGAEPSEDWLASRLILATAVVCGELADRADVGIERVQEALVSIDPSDERRLAQAHRRLGYLFRLRPAGIKSTNLTLSLAHFDLALRYFSKERSADEWAHLKVEIAFSLRERLAAWAREKIVVRDEKDYAFRRGNIESAVEALEDALTVFVESDFPEEHEEVSGTLVGFKSLLNRVPVDGWRSDEADRNSST